MLGACSADMATMNLVRCKHDMNFYQAVPDSSRKKLLYAKTFFAASRIMPIVLVVHTVATDNSQFFRGRTVLAQSGVNRALPYIGGTYALLTV